MRETQKMLTSDPRYSTFTGPSGKYGKIAFRSPVDTFRKLDEMRPALNYMDSSGWTTMPDRAGLGRQPLDDYNQSHIAREALALMQKTEASMPHKVTKLAEPHMAVTGGFWDTPSVLANLPLAARTRKRSKLAPMNIRLGFFFSAGISASSMAPHCAKLSRAIWDYVLAGGAVNLTVFHCEGPDAGNNKGTGTNGLIVETQVNCSDVAALSLALSPVYMRLTCFLLQSAHSDRGSNIPCPRTCPVPNCLFLGGALGEVFKAIDKICQDLQIK